MARKNKLPKKIINNKPNPYLIDIHVSKKFIPKKFSNIEKKKINGEIKEIEFKNPKYYNKKGQKVNPRYYIDEYKLKKERKKEKQEELAQERINSLKDNTFMSIVRTSNKLERLKKDYIKLVKVKNKKTVKFKKQEAELLNKIQTTLTLSEGLQKSFKHEEIKKNQYIVKKIKSNTGKIYYIKAKNEDGIQRTIEKIIKNQSKNYSKDKIMTSYTVLNISKQDYKLHFITPELEKELKEKGYDKYARKIKK